MFFNQNQETKGSMILRQKEEYFNNRDNMKMSSHYHHYDNPQFDLKSHRMPYQEEDYNQF